MLEMLQLYNLGSMYYKGEVIKDYKEAVKWFTKAAERFAMAQFTLGVMYRKGDGVPQDYKKAFKWNKLSADQGYVKAQPWCVLP